MKKLLLTLSIITLILFNCQQLYSQISAHSILSTGYEDRNMSFQYKGEEIKYPLLVNQMFTQMDHVITYKDILNVFTATKVYTTPKSITQYKPIQIEFWIGTQLIYRNFNVSFEHMCSHSIDSNFFRESINKITLSYILNWDIN